MQVRAKNPARRNRGDILACWVWVLPVLLAVAALSMRQIDLYPPTTDEFFSMFNSGWVINHPYSPTEVIQSLQDNSPNHTPGYFLLLSAWGNLTTFDVAIARVLTIFCALLALSIAYRLVRDFVAPVAGLFAVIIVASNAFYNFYIPHSRMYPLLLFWLESFFGFIFAYFYRLQSPKLGRLRRFVCGGLFAGKYARFERDLSLLARRLSPDRRAQEQLLVESIGLSHCRCTSVFAIFRGPDLRRY